MSLIKKFFGRHEDDPKHKTAAVPTGTQLKSLDNKLSKLSTAGRIDSARKAIRSANGGDIYTELSQCYGTLQEVICLGGPHPTRKMAILVFEGGVGLLAGADSFIPVLTYGYAGEGPHVFFSIHSRLCPHGCI